jgi:predicted porin
MKKSLLALAALTAFAGAASAQSSVTLFGVLDLAATSVNNGSAGTLRSLSPDGINSSRIGLRGLEDLGGGLQAGFWIEGGFDPSTGCGSQVQGAPSGTTCVGQNWQRRSTVSLIGKFGEIRLGRDYTTTFNNIAAFDPFGYNGIANVGDLRSTLGSGATTQVRASNTVAYFLPTLGGLYGQLQVAAGEGATGNKEVGGRLGYAAGPLNVAGAYQKTYKTGAMVDDYKTWNVGGSFNLGFATLAAVYEKNDYSVNDQKLYQLSAIVPLGNGNFKFAYEKSKGSSALINTSQWNASVLGVGYVYDLSKRTALYAQYARISNTTGASAATSSSFLVYSGNTAGYINGQSSSGYQFGIRHFF